MRTALQWCLWPADDKFHKKAHENNVNTGTLGFPMQTRPTSAQEDMKGPIIPQTTLYDISPYLRQPWREGGSRVVSKRWRGGKLPIQGNGSFVQWLCANKLKFYMY
jgi:hypothetical protein